VRLALIRRFSIRLSAPLYRLKRKARLTARANAIPLNQALNAIAKEEGFSSWSLLSAKMSKLNPAAQLFEQFLPGDLLLLAARPGYGKTLMALELIVQAIKGGRRGSFFTLEYNEIDLIDRLKAIGTDSTSLEACFLFDSSDSICASYIESQLVTAERGDVVVIDYLQLLDQKRGNSELSVQLSDLRKFASKTGVIFIFISQIDRAFDTNSRSFPSLKDIRMPNPFDLTHFSKACFVHDGEIELETTSKSPELAIPAPHA